MSHFKAVTNIHMVWECSVQLAAVSIDYNAHVYAYGNKFGCQLTLDRPLTEVHTVNDSVEFIEHVHGTAATMLQPQESKLIS